MRELRQCFVTLLLDGSSSRRLKLDCAAVARSLNSETLVPSEVEPVRIRLVSTYLPILQDRPRYPEPHALAYPAERAQLG